MKVQYYIPVSINESDMDRHDPSSEFYNNECNKHSTESGVDMTLYDRKNEYNNNNMSICEKNCTFNGIDPDTKKVVCDCNIKNDRTFNSEEIKAEDLLNQIDSQKSSSNLKVTQCINDVLEPEQIKSNSGFFLLLFILVIFIIVFIIFSIKGKRNLESKIDEIIYNKFEKEKKNKNKNDLDKNNKNKIIKVENKSKSEQKNIIKKITNKKKRKKKINNTKFNSKNKFINVSGKNENNLELFNKENKNPNLKGIILTKEENINLEVDEKPDNENDYELNTLSYILAIKYDKRSCCEYYTSLLKNKQLFLFTFCSFNDYNSGIIKKFIFFLSFAIHYTISALFFNDDTMHQIYEDEGSYNISFQLPKILISAVASTVLLRIMLETLILTDRNILEVKHQKTKQQAEIKKKKVLKCINIKFVIFFVLNFILLILFWFYLTCFNGIYENTQIYLFENTFISFGISLFFPIFWNIIPSVMRMCSLGDKKHDKECIYSVSKFCQLI